MTSSDEFVNPAPRRDERTPEQWRQVLSREQFRVTRKAGTEASSPVEESMPMAPCGPLVTIANGTRSARA